MAAFRGPGYNDGVPKSVDEAVVGIARFLTPDVPGFHGTIKERFSDFVVREVALDGHVVHLTKVKQFKDKKELKVSEIVKKRVLGYLEDAAAATPVDAVEGAFPVNNRVRGLVGRLAGRLLGMFNQNKRLAAIASDRASIAELEAIVVKVCDQDTASKLSVYLHQILQARIDEQTRLRESATDASSAPPAQEDAFFFPVIAEKDARMQIHQSLRDLGANLVISDTVNNEQGESVIRVRRMLVGGKKRKDIDQRSSRNQWPADRPDFLQFVLYKKNMETLSVISQLARAMGVNQSAFTYAGTKDKRGITTQLITVYRGSIEKLEALNKGRKDLQEFNFIVGNPSFVADRLNLGDLRGNRFTLAIRSLPSDAVISDEQIHRAVENWAQRGFINYFGLQRFGTRSIATHEIGRAILRRDYKLAIDLLMQPQEGDASKITEARQHFQDHQDVEAAMRSFPPYFIAEHGVLKGFQTHGLTAYSQAIACIPRHLRMMYTHSYQSYVWNTVVSERLTLLSTDKPVVGDLVIPQGVLDVDGDAAVDAEDAAAVVEDEEETSQPTKKRKMTVAAKSAAAIVVVTADNMDQYSIYDVVLPLPGYDIKYPENALRARYEEILAADGVDFSTLSRAANSEYHLPGSYRHILKKPIDVAHEIKRYEDPTLPLVSTDVDALVGNSTPVSVPEGSHRALCLEFQLGASSYATMAVRELMKQSSNLNVQLQLKEQQNAS
ncbi:hypothetical protein Poli38472_000317 [Pythium oligandrum]|uniref:TRUD domain-containing protein n=1 Tax=Pythium oligandrum TaxID=41045 RepID=A0A8K1CCG9_PYTOL|nr:hypothetical protein Poli38472_000317 [Pythium oligandrum]|eukprot:TMW60275.1 hypothetical protein Poli38472_000317 [Pythium oligandrum]